MRAPRTLALELVTFAALAWYATAHWTSGLVADPPGARAFACVAIAVAVAVALALTDAVRGPRGALLRGTCVVAGVGAGFVAIGLERGLLAPGRWSELVDGLDRGFAALGSAQWPYDGSEPWTTLVLLLAVPLVVVVAAGLTFWPKLALRPAGLVLLVALYGMAVTEHRFEGELGRGIGLLLLVAAWLWLPRMPERGWQAAVVGTSAVLAACVVALPAAARYDNRDAWVDYESWNPFAAKAATEFDWTHSYGPIDWPRDGTTLLNVRSEERHYWKVETLDLFDGLRWVRSGSGAGVRPALPFPYRESWETSFRVTIRDLDTSRLPIAGTPLEVSGSAQRARLDSDGTAAVASPLEEGDSYTVRAYMPDPTPEEMRAAPPTAADAITGSATLLLQPRGVTARDPYTPAGGILATDAEISRSPYAPVLSLARDLARGQETTYDVVRAVQRHLRSENFVYTERPQSRDLPLVAFLLEDRVGYCQQFSGAMALLLRMLDIPARVAAGFTPGSYNRDTREYRVRDLDAHSWVEVWFSGLGWVPFDPTPSVAPADSQSSVDAASASGGSADAGETQDPLGGEVQGALPESAQDAGGDASGDPAVAGWVAVIALALVAAIALAGMRVRAVVLGRRRAPEDEIALADLRRVLARIGEPVPPRVTLRQLEGGLQQTAGPAAARYVRMLRERRYAPRGGRAPDAAARRDLRRALGRGRGVRGRLLALAALPPVSFRRG